MMAHYYRKQQEEQARVPLFLLSCVCTDALLGVRAAGTHQWGGRQSTFGEVLVLPLRISRVLSLSHRGRGLCETQRMQREAEDADAFDPAWSDPRALRRELQGMTRIDIRSR